MTRQQEIAEKKGRWTSSVLAFIGFEVLLALFGVYIAFRPDGQLIKGMDRLEGMRAIVHTVGILSLICSVAVARYKMKLGSFSSVAEFQTFTFVALAVAELCMLFGLVALPRTHPVEFFAMAGATLLVSCLVIVPIGLRTWAEMEKLP